VRVRGAVGLTNAPSHHSVPAEAKESPHRQDACKCDPRPRINVHARAFSFTLHFPPLLRSAGRRGSQALKLKGIDRTRSMELLNHMEQQIFIEATMDECYAAAVGFEDYPKWAGDVSAEIFSSRHLTTEQRTTTVATS